MVEKDKNFGLLLYEELKRLGRGSLITGKMKYADIQRLKAADRVETTKLFRGSSYETIQRIKEDSPAQVAAYLLEQAERSQGQQSFLLDLVIFGSIMFGD